MFKMGGRPWKENEMEILKQYYPNTKTSEIAEMLPGRSEGSIIGKAGLMGLERDEDYNKTPAQKLSKEFLHKEYAVKNKSMSKIEKETGISRRAIQRRISSLGITKEYSNVRKLPYYVWTICSHCKGNFKEDKSDYKRAIAVGYENRYCSKGCLVAAQSENMSGEGNHNYGGTYNGLHYRDMTREQQLARNAKVSRTRIETGISSGENNGRWKGGISSITQFLRRQTTEWRARVYEEFDGKCVITGRTDNIDVHHLQPFYIVRDEVVTESGLPLYETTADYTLDELEDLRNRIIAKHEDILGVTVHTELHELFHRLYGFDMTPDDFYEFLQRCLNDEFITEEQAIV